MAMAKRTSKAKRALEPVVVVDVTEVAPGFTMDVQVMPKVDTQVEKPPTSQVTQGAQKQ